MDRTNAERQRRYIARLKAKAEAIDAAAEAMKNSTCSKCGKKAPNPIIFEAGPLKILLCQKCGMKLLSKHAAQRPVLEWKTDAALKKIACMIAYNPTRKGDYPRGWYIREYHSPIAMKNHLKGKKGWEKSYIETGPYRTEKAARELELE